MNSNSACIAFLESIQHEHKVRLCIPEGAERDVKPPVNESRVAELRDQLRHYWPRDTKFPDEIAVVHYLSMLAYANAALRTPEWEERMAEDTRKRLAIRDCEEYLRRLLTDTSFRAYFPWPGLLQGELWWSLAVWHDHYGPLAQAGIGEYLIAVHIEHARKYGRLFRSEFVMACVWNKSADWTVKYMSLYDAVETGRQAIRSAVEAASLHGISPIRFLGREWSEHGLWQDELEWYARDDLDVCGDVPTCFYVTVPSEKEPLLTSDEERQVNDSLRRAFLG